MGVVLALRTWTTWNISLEVGLIRSASSNSHSFSPAAIVSSLVSFPLKPAAQACSANFSPHFVE